MVVHDARPIPLTSSLTIEDLSTLGLATNGQTGPVSSQQRARKTDETNNHSDACSR